MVWGAEEKLTEEIVEENTEEIVEENKEATVEESTEETAEESEELVGADDYTFDMVLSKDSDYHVGDTVTLTAQVYRNGEKVTDLAEAGLSVYFWKDEWTGDYQTEGYTLENDGNSGRSLTATVTFTEPGEYNVGYNLQDSTWSTIAGNNYAQFSVTEEAQQGTSVTVVPDITDDLHVGDTVTLTATLTQDGVKITDLNTVDCYMYFWGDDWSDDYCHNFTMEKDDNGKSLSAKITFHEAGAYRVGYDVEDAEWKKIVPDTYIEFEVKEEVKPVEADIDVERVSTLTDDFIMGMDISSAPSLIDAGVIYGDWDGNKLGGDDSQAKLNKFVIYHGKKYDALEGAKILIENQLKGIKKIADSGITVKVNTVLVPRINGNHIAKIAETVAAAGATIYNIIPLIPTFELENEKAPLCFQIEQARKDAEKYIKV